MIVSAREREMIEALRRLDEHQREAIVETVLHLSPQDDPDQDRDR